MLVKDETSILLFTSNQPRFPKLQLLKFSAWHLEFDHSLYVCVCVLGEGEVVQVNMILLLPHFTTYSILDNFPISLMQMKGL